MDCFKGLVECSIFKIARKACADRETLLENRVGLGIYKEDRHFDLLPKETVRVFLKEKVVVFKR